MKRPTALNMSTEELKALRDRAREGRLRPEDNKLVEALAETVVALGEAVEQKGTSIRRLLKLIFGSPTERKDDLFDKRGEEDPPPEGGSAAGTPNTTGSKPKGHGRNGADSYTGAKRIAVPHPELKPATRCPACAIGKLHHHPSSPLIYVEAQPPVTATRYDLERLRCGACGKVFTAPAPAGASQHKYHGNVGVMIALLKYGSGMPFARLERLEKMSGIPLPASVQWKLVEEAGKPLKVILDKLQEHAADGQVLHNDDTSMKVLELMKQRDQSEATETGKPQRRGIFTTGIISVVGTHRIALFRTGHQHAGENLTTVLEQRSADVGKPILMCDALSRNLPKELEVLLANCLAHARRQFVDIIEAFPDSCRYVIEQLADVYKNDAYTKEQDMEPSARLDYHQQYSGPVMEELEIWCRRQLDERLVEPNSGLGGAISYMLRHWKALTLFLEQSGAPLDNNICERALKKAILHRKNSLFYKTQNGARIGDMFMSLIHTCELNGVNAWHYLSTLTKYAVDLATAPEQWLPWSYQDAAAALEAGSDNP